MGDSQPVQLRGKARHLDLERPEPHPARFEPTPGEAREGYRPEDEGNPDEAQTSSFSITRVTGTTWRWNFSFDASKPAATPISCDR